MNTVEKPIKEKKNVYFDVAETKRVEHPVNMVRCYAKSIKIERKKNRAEMNAYVLAHNYNT